MNYVKIINIGIDYLKSIKRSSHFWRNKFSILPFGENPRMMSLFEIIKFEGIELDSDLIDSHNSYLIEDKKLMDRIRIQSQYDNGEMKQLEEINELKKHESINLPHDFDYDLLNISNEAKEKLRVAKPTTLGQASRLPGMPPVAIFKILNYFKYKNKNFSI
jgi:tRNA U34 5-carboxymethylaminomethyl modifying enzyme MnmG/GidA